MKKIRNPHRHVEVDTLRDAVINHAYCANMNTSVVEGIRHVSDAWLIARRHQSLDNIMREVKSRQSDPDIARITSDLQHPQKESGKTKLSAPEYALAPELDWMMV